MNTYDVVVIGGGPAGMMAAGQAAQTGARVLLLEKNREPGKKILITGKGRCNVTNDASTAELVAEMPGNGRFLFSAFSAFGSQELQAFFERLGVPLKVERGRRVFPVSDQAADIRDALVRFINVSGVHLEANSPARELTRVEEHSFEVRRDRGSDIRSRTMIIATGGLSYPGTGSTGDGYQWAQHFGHHIVTQKPSLVQLLCHEAWVRELQGLSLRNVAVRAMIPGGSIISEDFGEMLFTHDGVSGPAILTLSREIVRTLEAHPTIHLELDLKPSLTVDQLDQRLMRDFTQFQRKQFKNALGDLLPRKLIPVIIRLSQIQPDKFVHQISKDERMKLLQLLKSLRMTIYGTYPITEAVVTMGGVHTREIDPKTMSSKLVPGLYFAGEVLDVDGYTGGFNLQAAFSTGYLAGCHAARHALSAFIAN